MKMKSVPACVLLVLLLATSCSTPKDIAYFQNIDELANEQKSQMYRKYTSQICPDDMLSITVSSATPDVVTPFNPPLYASTTPQRSFGSTISPQSLSGSTSLTNTPQLTTYPVNSDGDITFPVIGKFHAAGLSRQEFEIKLQTEIRKYAPDAIVHAKIENYKVTVLGEVTTPGPIPVYNERITILEAIGQAGDLTINGDRKNILVIRDNNGQAEPGRVDITDPAIFASEYYYLRQNDVVYIEPNSAKKRNSTVSQGTTVTISIITAAITGISTLSAVAIAIFTKIK